MMASMRKKTSRFKETHPQRETALTVPEQLQELISQKGDDLILPFMEREDLQKMA
jgi:hypothetical protein